jgi:hypothetical protein
LTFVEGTHGMIRADTIRHTANPGKVAGVMAFVRP